MALRVNGIDIPGFVDNQCVDELQNGKFAIRGNETNCFATSIAT